jgi:hypothetical protein
MVLAYFHSLKEYSNTVLHCFADFFIALFYFYPIGSGDFAEDWCRYRAVVQNSILVLTTLSKTMEISTPFPERLRNGILNYEDTKTKCRLYWCLIYFID